MHRRIIEGYTKYFKHGLEGEKNELMKRIMQEKMMCGDPWMNTVKKYVNEVDLGRKPIKETSLQEIKEKHI